MSAYQNHCGLSSRQLKEKKVGELLAHVFGSWMRKTEERRRQRPELAAVETSCKSGENLNSDNQAASSLFHSIRA